MRLEDNSQAILLLTAHLSTPRRDDPTPLTPNEYGKLSKWLRERKLQPRDLVSDFDKIRLVWDDLGKRITLDRVEYLVGRAMALGVALEKWNSAGIWILTRADREYPERLKRHLGESRPPVLFGVGNRALLDKGGLAVVGSRRIDGEDRAYAEEIARAAANAGLNVVSGGAKGVDETAMRAALEAQGTALGVLADSLLPAALSGKWRPYLKSKDLCLISSYYPEAGFNVGNAMGRNKYIYCLSDYSLVVRSEKGKGGTWAGAIEALKQKLAPVFVKLPSDEAGNLALVDQGARRLPTPDTIRLGPQWLAEALRGPTSDSSAFLATSVLKLRPMPSAPATTARPIPLIEPEWDRTVAPSEEMKPTDSTSLFFEFFILQVHRLLAAKPYVTPKELKASHPDLASKQLTDWLKRAVDEGRLERAAGKAPHYSKAGNTVEAQPGLFDAKGTKR